MHHPIYKKNPNKPEKHILVQIKCLFAVNAGLVESHVIRQSPQDWRAGQSSVAVSWKSSLLPANTTQVLVDVVAYKVGVFFVFQWLAGLLFVF